MKTTLLVLTIAALASCTSVKQTSNQALDEAKANGASGFYANRIDNGYEVGGNAETTVFRLNPYATFKVGVRVVPKEQVLPPVEVIATK